MSRKVDLPANSGQKLPFWCNLNISEIGAKKGSKTQAEVAFPKWSSTLTIAKHQSHWKHYDIFQSIATSWDIWSELWSIESREKELSHRVALNYAVLRRRDKTSVPTVNASRWNESLLNGVLKGSVKAFIQLSDVSSISSGNEDVHWISSLFIALTFLNCWFISHPISCSTLIYFKIS